MKLSYAVYCTLFVAILIGHSTAASINKPGKSACGSGATADYKGACDESVPVVVMPKGRPIMERVLDWFKCDNEECQPESPKEPESSEETTTPEPKPITTGNPYTGPPTQTTRKTVTPPEMLSTPPEKLSTPPEMLSTPPPPVMS